MVANVVYLPRVYINHYYYGVIGIKKNSRIKSKTLKTEGLGKKKICIYETYKNMFMTHGHHIYTKAPDMEKATMCAYTQSYHALPHCKCVMQCCAKFPSINIPDQETDDQYSNTSPSISFHIYHIIARCKTHGRILLTDKKICCKCKQDTVSEKSTKYTLEKS